MFARSNILPLRVGAILSDSKAHSRHTPYRRSVTARTKAEELGLVLLRHGVYHLAILAL